MYQVCFDIQQFMFYILVLLVVFKCYNLGLEFCKGDVNVYSSNDIIVIIIVFVIVRLLIQEVSVRVVFQGSVMVLNQVNLGCRFGMSDLCLGQDFFFQDSQQFLGKVVLISQLRFLFLCRVLYFLQQNLVLIYLLVIGSFL